MRGGLFGTIRSGILDTLDDVIGMCLCLGRLVVKSGCTKLTRLIGSLGRPHHFTLCSRYSHPGKTERVAEGAQEYWGMTILGRSPSAKLLFERISMGRIFREIVEYYQSSIQSKLAVLALRSSQIERYSFA